MVSTSETGRTLEILENLNQTISLKDIRAKSGKMLKKILADLNPTLYKDCLDILKAIKQGSAKAKIIEHQLKTIEGLGRGGRLDVSLQSLFSGSSVDRLVDFVSAEPKHYPEITTPAFLKFSVLKQYLKNNDLTVLNFLWTLEDEDEDKNENKKLKDFASHLPALLETDKSCFEFSSDHANRQFFTMHLMPLLKLTQSLSELILESIEPSVTEIVVKNALDATRFIQKIGLNRDYFLKLIESKILGHNNSFSSKVPLALNQKEALQEMGINTLKADFTIQKLENGELHLQKIKATEVYDIGYNPAGQELTVKDATADTNAIIAKMNLKNTSSFSPTSHENLTKSDLMGLGHGYVIKLSLPGLLTVDNMEYPLNEKFITLIIENWEKLGEELRGKKTEDARAGLRDKKARAFGVTAEDVRFGGV